MASQSKNTHVKPTSERASTVARQASRSP